jgi:hypothetical protein
LKSAGNASPTQRTAPQNFKTPQTSLHPCPAFNPGQTQSFNWLCNIYSVNCYQRQSRYCAAFCLLELTIPTTPCLPTMQSPRVSRKADFEPAAF